MTNPTYSETTTANDDAAATARSAYSVADWAALQAAYDTTHAQVLAERLGWGYSAADAGDVARLMAYNARADERVLRGLPPVR